MDLASYRKDVRGLSQEAAAAELGLRSKGYYSRLEGGHEKWPLRLALKVEAWSAGVVDALGLVSDEDAELLKASARRLAGGDVAEAALP